MANPTYADPRSDQALMGWLAQFAQANQAGQPAPAVPDYLQNYAPPQSPTMQFSGGGVPVPQAPPMVQQPSVDAQIDALTKRNTGFAGYGTPQGGR